MAAFRRLAVEDLLSTYLSFSDAVRKVPGQAAFTLALMIIRHFLGDEWILDHLDTSTRTDGFMRLDLSEPVRGYIQTFKVVDLAEMLFNLRNIPGFADCVTEMRTEALIESRVAELDIGRMLYIRNYDFSFVTRRSEKRADYDLEIRLDKWTACAEVKCKLEKTPITATTIEGALREGRRQLPATKPGMLFVKVPQNWMLKYLHAQLMADSARTFLRKAPPVGSGDTMG